MNLFFYVIVIVSVAVSGTLRIRILRLRKISNSVFFSASDLNRNFIREKIYNFFKTNLCFVLLNCCLDFLI